MVDDQIGVAAPKVDWLQHVWVAAAFISDVKPPARLDRWRSYDRGSPPALELGEAVWPAFPLEPADGCAAASLCSSPEDWTLGTLRSLTNRMRT